MVTISYDGGTVVLVKEDTVTRLQTEIDRRYITPWIVSAVWIMPSVEGSGDVLPYHHPAWRDLEALFARLDALDDVDADLDENWLRNLRRDTRLSALYATDDRE